MAEVPKRRSRATFSELTVSPTDNRTSGTLIDRIECVRVTFTCFEPPSSPFIIVANQLKMDKLGVLITLVLAIELAAGRSCVASLIMRGSRRHGVKYYLRFRNQAESSSRSESLLLFPGEESVFPLVIVCIDGHKGTVQELDLANVDASLLFHNECCEFPLHKDYFKIFSIGVLRGQRRLKPVNFE